MVNQLGEEPDYVLHAIRLKRKTSYSFYDYGQSLLYLTRSNTRVLDKKIVRFRRLYQV